MIIPGQTMYVIEVEPAAYAALAANEAEKAADINILEVRAFGSMGRVYLGGEEKRHRRRMARRRGGHRRRRGAHRRMKPEKPQITQMNADIRYSIWTLDAG